MRFLLILEMIDNQRVGKMVLKKHNEKGQKAMLLLHKSVDLTL